jgi:hypothetical protein
MEFGTYLLLVLLHTFWFDVIEYVYDFTSFSYFFHIVLSDIRIIKNKSCTTKYNKNN